MVWWEELEHPRPWRDDYLSGDPPRAEPAASEPLDVGGPDYFTPSRAFAAMAQPIREQWAGYVEMGIPVDAILTAAFSPLVAGGFPSEYAFTQWWNQSILEPSSPPGAAYRAALDWALGEVHAQAEGFNPTRVAMLAMKRWGLWADAYLNPAVSEFYAAAVELFHLTFLPPHYPTAEDLIEWFTSLESGVEFAHRARTFGEDLAAMLEDFKNLGLFPEGTRMANASVTAAFESAGLGVLQEISAQRPIDLFETGRIDRVRLHLLLRSLGSILAIGAGSDPDLVGIDQNRAATDLSLHLVGGYHAGRAVLGTFDTGYERVITPLDLVEIRARARSLAATDSLAPMLGPQGLVLIGGKGTSTTPGTLSVEQVNRLAPLAGLSGFAAAIAEYEVIGLEVGQSQPPTAPAPSAKGAD